MFSWQNFLEDTVENFSNERYNFNNIAEINIITKAKKLDMTYDFHIKHKMHAVEWKLNAILNKNGNLINKVNRSKRHPIIRELSHILFSDA